MKKIFDFIAWFFGIFSTAILLAVAVSIIINLPSQASLPKEICYTKIQLDMALETVKTLMPMTAGYIIFSAPAINYLKDKNVLWNNAILLGTILTFAFGITSFGLWSGVLAFLLNASRAIDTQLNDYSSCNYSWNRVVKVSSLAHLCFFISIAWFITTTMLTLNQERVKK